MCGQVGRRAAGAARVPVSDDRPVPAWLRRATAFLSADRMRSGQLSALGQDVINLADALHLDHVAIAGHDWGAPPRHISPRRSRPIGSRTASRSPSAGGPTTRDRRCRSRRRGITGITGKLRWTAAGAPSRCSRVWRSRAFSGRPGDRPDGSATRRSTRPRDPSPTRTGRTSRFTPIATDGDSRMAIRITPRSKHGCSRRRSSPCRRL